jgi:hypothetical protein
MSATAAPLDSIKTPCAVFMFSPVESWRAVTIAVNVFHAAEAFVSSSATQDIACAKKYHHGSAKWSRQSVGLAHFYRASY